MHHLLRAKRFIHQTGVGTLRSTPILPLLGFGIGSGDVSDKVADTARIAVLVVVLNDCQRPAEYVMRKAHPTDELDKVGVEGDTGLGVEDGRLGAANEVGRDNLVLGVARLYDQQAKSMWTKHTQECPCTRGSRQPS
jgi:hypothetical protein